MNSLQKSRLRVLLIWAAVLLGASAALLFLALRGIRIPCLFYELTGLYCPGCGNTRAAVALWRLDPAGALRCNLLFPLEFFYLLWVAGVTAVRWLKGHGLGYRPPLPGLDIFVLAALLVWGVLRNMPGFPAL